jgi:hypothetical protein
MLNRFGDESLRFNAYLAWPGKNILNLILKKNSDFFNLIELVSSDSHLRITLN